MKALVLVALLVLAGLPIIAGVGGSLLSGLQSSAWATLLATPGIGRSVLLSLGTGLGATALSLLIAHLTVMFAATGRWSGRLRTLVLPLIALPHLAMGIGLALALSPSGLLLRLFSPWATGLRTPPDWQTIQDPVGLSLLLGLVVKESPFLVLALAGALYQVPFERLLNQARTLGYGRLKGWLVSAAPLLQRQIRLPVAAVLVYGIGNVEMAIPLGPQMPPTLGVVVWQWFVSGNIDQRGVAASGALLLLATATAALALWRFASPIGSAVTTLYATSGRRCRHDQGWRRAAAAAPTGIALLGALAIAAIALRALHAAWRFPAVLPPHANLSAFTLATPGLATAFVTTLAVAMLTAMITVILAIAVIETLWDDAVLRKRLAYLVAIPLLIPQLGFLFGWQVALVRLRLDGTLGAVVWSHVVLALPYAWGVLAGARNSLDPRLPLAARVLGASPMRAWMTITLPLLLRPLLLAAALAFSVSAAVYLPTQFAGAGRIATVATEAAAAAASGNLNIAAAYAAAQMTAPLLAMGAAIGIGSALFARRRGVPR
jgi:putative thiamine transport system permease protein